MEDSSGIDGGVNILFCRKCGGRLLPDALFCVRCGERVKIAARAAQPWQPDQDMPTKTAAAPYPSALADAKREKEQAAPRKPMKPWLMVLLSAVGSFVVFGTVVLVVLTSMMK